MGSSKLATGYPDWTVISNQTTSFISGNWSVTNSSNNLLFTYSSTNVAILNSSGLFSTYGGLTTAGNGFPIILGTIDNRKGVTVADSSSIVLYTTTSATNVFRVCARILAIVGSSATYTISWKENGVTQSIALSVTAVNTEYHASFDIQPDSATTIIAKITALTSSTVNVESHVEEIV